ncbi:hypothetical protein [Streptomyces virginiae]|uniref:Uncharacterized protein n=1 Tax=Streptomyces virginiae TaxID=1961 RepID=A0ABZ1T5P9_STRVG|nr:hypothetical protein [Streptomyces virginiae]
MPAFAIGMAVSCGPGPGRRDAHLDHDAPRLVERADQGWYELVSAFGLFGADREFLRAQHSPRPK